MIELAMPRSFSRVFGPYFIPTRFGRVSLLVLSGIVFAAILVDVLTSSRLPLAALVCIYVCGGLVLFVWHPPGALLVLLFGGLAVLPFSSLEIYGLVLCAASGLAVSFCGRRATVLFVGVTTLIVWIGFVTQKLDRDIPLGALVCLLIVSTTLGASFRSARRRQIRLAARISNLEAAQDRAVRAERLRIADALHSTIANDISVVVMNVQALRITIEPQDSRETMDAIERSARQALADIGRIVQLIEGPETNNAEA
ncbi:histidine kinase [Leucobacter luti]|uniref:histidine kinase n=1 Tax=Leucobacter luti TaxID=340320 RepID=A0A4R6S6G0_9MICO|nr:histidine kinase [Leucobacter luti]TDP95360.1 histidine kinase [Leucobacter luti]